MHLLSGLAIVGVKGEQPLNFLCVFVSLPPPPFQKYNYNVC